MLVSFFLLRELASLTSLSILAFKTDRTINRSHEFVPNGGTPFYLALEAPPTAARVLSRYREERAKTADLRLALRRALVPGRQPGRKRGDLEDDRRRPAPSRAA